MHKYPNLTNKEIREIISKIPKPPPPPPPPKQNCVTIIVKERR